MIEEFTISMIQQLMFLFQALHKAQEDKGDDSAEHITLHQWAVFTKVQQALPQPIHSQRMLQKWMSMSNWVWLNVQMSGQPMTVERH